MTSCADPQTAVDADMSTEPMNFSVPAHSVASLDTGATYSTASQPKSVRFKNKAKETLLLSRKRIAAAGPSRRTNASAEHATSNILPSCSQPSFIPVTTTATLETLVPSTAPSSYAPHNSDADAAASGATRIASAPLEDVVMHDVFEAPRPIIAARPILTREEHRRQFEEYAEKPRMWKALYEDSLLLQDFLMIMHRRGLYPRVLLRECPYAGFGTIIARIRTVSERHGVSGKCSDHEWTREELAFIFPPYPTMCK